MLLTITVIVFIAVEVLLALPRLLVSPSDKPREYPRIVTLPLSFLVSWAIPILVISVLDAGDPARPGLPQIFVSYFAVAIAGAILIAVIEQILDRIAPPASAVVRRAMGDPHEIISNEFAKAKAEQPLKGEIRTAMTELETANARFARGPEFMREHLRPGFDADWASLAAAIAGMRTALAVSGGPTPPSVSERLADASSRLATLSAQSGRRI